MTAEDKRATCFFNAVAGGDRDVVRDMVAAEPGLLSSRCQDEQGQPDKTALHIAAKGADHGMAELLVALGAPIEAEDRFGLTPLLLAAHYNNVAMAKQLVAAGADPLATTSDGITGAMFAAQQGSVEMTGYFLAQGVPINARRDCGMTVLHFARHAKEPDAVLDLLLEAGADPKLKGGSDVTPSELAIKMGQESFHTALTCAIRRKEERAAAKIISDRKDLDVLENGLPRSFNVRRRPIVFARNN